MTDWLQDEKPILNDRDRDILTEYESADEIENRGDLADYIRGMARLVLSSAQKDSFHVGDVLRVVGVANDLERGEYTMDEIREWYDNLSFKDGVEEP